VSTEVRSLIAYYERHPITAELILAKLKASRGHLDNLAPEELFPHDQDHYGGIDANDALAHRAGIGEGSRMADFCAGLGGPARYYAHCYGADVTGIELTPARIKGAEELTRRVGLQDAVRVVRGNVMQVPLPDACVDVVGSQEALLHVPDKERTLAEAFRILKPGGRIAFTDWVAHRPLSLADSELMRQGMVAIRLQSLQKYTAVLEAAGFKIQSVEDLTKEWAVILEQRFAMYRQLRKEAQQVGTPDGNDAFYESYARLVDLMNNAELGGGRFVGEKPK